MNPLKPGTVLKRATGIEICLDSSAEAQITVNEHSDFHLQRSLGVLEVFANPTALQDALQQLKAHGTQDWIDLTGTLNKLYRNGALIELGAAQLTPEPNSDGFGAPAIHISMLNDRGRTTAFQRAITEVVRPGDVVVDIGTGTGILAVTAARAGAARVYAIESGAMAEAAAAVFAASDVAEKLTLIRGWSTQVELPERADVLITETVGFDPYAERILQITKDARRRLLKPDARLVPARIKTYGMAVTIPADKVAQVAFTAETIARWRDWFRVDFTPLLEIVEESSLPQLNVPQQQAATWPILTKPVLLAETDLASFRETVIESAVEAQITQAGVLNGFLMFFELTVGSETITTHPLQAAADNHWPNPVWICSKPREVLAGDRLRINYGYNVAGQNSTVHLA
jgi:16S rRNA G966 N2-methylase RsmD